MADIHGNSDVCIRKDRTVFDHRSPVHVAVLFNAAAARDHGVLPNPRSTADVCRRYNSRALVNLCSFIDPHPRLDFRTRRTHCATPTKRIGSQAAQVTRVSQPAYIFTNKVRTAGALAADQDVLDIHLESLGTIDDPKFQGAVTIYRLS